MLMLGKCNPLSQLRLHETKIQITHAEHCRESDNLFLNKYFLIMNIDIRSIQRKIEKVNGIRNEKSSKDMASSRNLVSTVGAQASPTMGDGTRCPENDLLIEYV